MKQRGLCILLTAALAAGLTGCGSYYPMTPPDAAAGSAEIEDNSLAYQKQAEEFVHIDEALDAVMQAESYGSSSVEEKRDAITKKLSEMERVGAVTKGSVSYDENTETVWYEWGGGCVAGVELEERPAGISGNAKTDSFVTEWNKTDTSFANNYDGKIPFSDPAYPFAEADVKNCKLTAKYMVGFGDPDDSSNAFHGVMKNYKENESIWGKNHLDTEIDWDCTIDDFKTGISGYDLLIIEEHGAMSSKQEPLICTEERLNMATALENFADMQKKRLYVVKEGSGHTFFRIAPSFFDYYYGDGGLEGTIIWLGSCYGYMTPALADTLIKCGAEAVVGYTEAVYTVYDMDLHAGFVYDLMWGDTVSEALAFTQSLFKGIDTDYMDLFSPPGSHSFEDEVKMRGKKLSYPAAAKLHPQGKNARLFDLKPAEKGSAAEEPETEPAPATEPVPEAVNYQKLYREKLAELSRYPAEHGMSDYQVYYTLCDMDGNGVPEMIVRTGTCEADAMIAFYSADSSGLFQFTECGGSHTAFYWDNDSDRFAILSGYMGTGYITWFGCGSELAVTLEQQDNVSYIDDQYAFDAYGDFTELQTSYNYYSTYPDSGHWTSYMTNDWDNQIESSAVSTELLDRSAA